MVSISNIKDNQKYVVNKNGLLSIILGVIFLVILWVSESTLSVTLLLKFDYT